MSMSGRACVVQIGQYTLGTAGVYTRQVLSLTELRRVPRSPSALLGIFASRSQVIPVIALEALLALEVPKHELAVQLEYSGRHFAIGIDAALGFVGFEPVGVAVPVALERICQGATRFQEQIVPVLDLSRVLEELAGVFGGQNERTVFTAPSTIARVLS